MTSITHCRDTYTVKTSDGQSMDYWERNLRFKTDTSEIGPVKGAPAIIGAGMAGDRASVIFSAPEEISALDQAELLNQHLLTVVQSPCWPMFRT